MIQITFTIPLSPGSNLATQLAEATNADLGLESLEVPGLTLVPGSDTTAYNGTNLVRTIQLTETADFIARMGLPFTDAKRKSAVAHMFDYRLTQLLRKTVSEVIQLF